MGNIRTVMHKGTVNIHPLNKDISYYENLGFEIGVYRTEEEILTRSRKCSESAKKQWENYDELKYNSVCTKISDRCKERSEEEKLAIYNKYKFTISNYTEEEKYIIRKRRSESHKLSNKTEEEASRISNNISEGTKKAIRHLSEEKRQEMRLNLLNSIKNRPLNKELERKQKRNESLSNHKSWNSSSSEDKCFDILKTIFSESDIIRSYSDSRYTFNCDFYIPSKDLFIEYNGYWTHGPHPFNKDNKNDQELLAKWLSKNLPSYQNAVYTWTDLDVRKLSAALEYKLNYIRIYPYKSLEYNKEINNNIYSNIIEKLIF